MGPAPGDRFAANALVVVLLGPVVEECTFRGLGFRLLERFGDRAAILLTGTSFALSHGLVGFLPATAVFGIGLGYLRSRTGSLYPGLVLHVLFNTLGVLGTSVLDPARLRARRVVPSDARTMPRLRSLGADRFRSDLI